MKGKINTGDYEMQLKWFQEHAYEHTPSYDYYVRLYSKPPPVDPKKSPNQSVHTGGTNCDVSSSSKEDDYSKDQRSIAHKVVDLEDVPEQKSSTVSQPSTFAWQGSRKNVFHDVSLNPISDLNTKASSNTENSFDNRHFTQSRTSFETANTIRNNRLHAEHNFIEQSDAEGEEEEEVRSDSGDMDEFINAAPSAKHSDFKSAKQLFCNQGNGPSQEPYQTFENNVAAAVDDEDDLWAAIDDFDDEELSALSTAPPARHNSEPISFSSSSNVSNQSNPHIPNQETQRKLLELRDKKREISDRIMDLMDHDADNPRVRELRRTRFVVLVAKTKNDIAYRESLNIEIATLESVQLAKCSSSAAEVKEENTIVTFGASQTAVDEVQSWFLIS